MVTCTCCVEDLLLLYPGMSLQREGESEEEGQRFVRRCVSMTLLF